MDGTGASTDSTSEFPQAWLWDADGDIIEASFVRFDVGPTKLYGKKPIVVVNVGDEERAVWLTTTVLFESFKEELEQRENHTLEPGEKLTIRWLGKAEPKTGGPAYHRHKVVFHNSPGSSAEALFGFGTQTKRLGESEEDAEPAAIPDAVDDGIPY